MWISRRISSILHKKVHLHSTFSNKRTQPYHISFVLAVISTEKDTIIHHLELQQLNHHDNGKLLYHLKENEQFIIHVVDYNEIPANLESLNGALVCYNTTDKHFTSHLPRIMNALVSQNIACLLIRLKSNLDKTQHSNHLTIGGIKAIEINHATIKGIQQLQILFMQLIYSDNDKQRHAIDQQRPVLIQTETDKSATQNDAVTEKRNALFCAYDSSNSTTTITSQTNSTCSTATEIDKSLLDIVNEVIVESKQDQNESIIFIALYRKFMKPLDLVTVLIQRFEMDLSIHSQSLPTIKQEIIVDFFCTWMTQNWEDFTSSATRRTLYEFLERISTWESLSTIHDRLLPLVTRDAAQHDLDSSWGMCDEEDEIKNKVQRKKDSGYCESFDDWMSHDGTLTQKKKQPTIRSTTTKFLSSSLKRAASTNTHHRIPASFRSMLSVPKQDNRRNSTPIPSQSISVDVLTCSRPEIFGGGLFTIAKPDTLWTDPFAFVNLIEPNQVADQLTWIEAEIFQKIQPRDFLRHLWSERRKRRLLNDLDKSPVSASIEHFNFVSGWIASLVVSQTALQKRVLVYEYCLKIAVKLAKLNNFNTLMAVLAGMNSAAVLRLKMTKESVRLKNPNLYQQFSELESLMSSERSFHNYRSALKQSEFPGIPYLGVHQQDLVSLSEANKDHMIDGRVHWKKFLLMGESILEMMRFRQSNYHTFEPHFDVLYFISHESILTEDERYAMSQLLEPRALKPSVSSTSHVSFRWQTALK